MRFPIVWSLSKSVSSIGLFSWMCNNVSLREVRIKNKTNAWSNDCQLGDIPCTHPSSSDFWQCLEVFGWGLSATGNWWVEARNATNILQHPEQLPQQGILEPETSVMLHFENLVENMKQSACHGESWLRKLWALAFPVAWSRNPT